MFSSTAAPSVPCNTIRMSQSRPMAMFQEHATDTVVPDSSVSVAVAKSSASGSVAERRRPRAKRLPVASTMGESSSHNTRSTRCAPEIHQAPAARRPVSKPSLVRRGGQVKNSLDGVDSAERAAANEAAQRVAGGEVAIGEVDVEKAISDARRIHDAACVNPGRCQRLLAEHSQAARHRRDGPVCLQRAWRCDDHAVQLCLEQLIEAAEDICAGGQTRGRFRRFAAGVRNRRHLGGTAGRQRGKPVPADPADAEEADARQRRLHRRAGRDGRRRGPCHGITPP